VLSSLEQLSLAFQSPQSRPDRETRRPPPSKRSVIPALHYFKFKGVNEYLEDLVRVIDTPRLNMLDIIFFNEIDFDTPRLARFIKRTPKLRKGDAHIRFGANFARIGLEPPGPGLAALSIAISCREPDWQLSSIEQVSLHSTLSTIENLYIEHRYRQPVGEDEPVWKDDAIENGQWLQLLLPFTAMKNLYLSEKFAPGIAAALQELEGDRITEVLPSLENIFVNGLKPSGPFQENKGQFVAARQLSDHPVTISDWEVRKGPDVIELD
jgi:hypothetical protein